LTSLSEGQRKILTQWHPDQRVKVKVAEPKKITTYVYNGQPDPDGQILNCAPGAILPDGKPIAVLCRTIEQATTDDSGATGFNASPVGASRVWNYTYNGVGQLLSADGPRDDNGIIDKTTYEYYTDTTVTHTIGDLRIVTNAKGHVTEFLEYNKSGKATKIKYPNTTIAKLTYSPRGWLTSRTTGTETTGYEYDSVGQLKKVTLPDGAFLNYTYDDAHRLTRIEDGLGNSISYTLDLRGNRTSEQVRDSSGTLARQTTRVFDALNRLEQVMGGVQ
jgi:YD repeat-containing protein